MPLAGHLRELRDRLAKALLAVTACTVVAACYSERLVSLLLGPVPRCAQGRLGRGGACAVVAFQDLMSPFGTTVKVSVAAGVVAASPVWLYQLWAFVAPGLHRRERRYAYGFVALAAPLFAGGAVLAWLMLPVSIRVLLSITPEAASNILALDDVLDFATRMVLVFGLSFQLPVLLLMLNVAGVVSGRRMAGWWRGVVMGILLFGALVTPTTDPVGMCVMAGPVILLYFLVVWVARANDRRRANRDGRDGADLDPTAYDDEIAALLDPVPVVGA
ncbi:twin-arginine translocase subunit TatC [Streptomyces sp. NPDC001941]|uniref:twin-arginine translocase subunit TatC n=1 Tax=Streptomyces sp. NPDC001941 TaxID=3154659 RepID=UPI003319670D